VAQHLTPPPRALSQDLPRPFAKLRALDLDKAAADVVAAL
jgi:hypothetical protein